MSTEFELTEAEATLEAFKPKTKKGATGTVPCAELVISCLRDADVLAHFSPDLKALLFNANATDLVGGLQLRDPHMVFPMRRDEEMGGAKVKIRVGIQDSMLFEEVGIDNFELTAKDGGGVIVGCRISCQPTEIQAGQLYMMQGQQIDITIEPRPLAEMQAAA